MTRPGPSVTSAADTQPGSDSLFPTGFSGGGALVRQGSVGTGEITDGSVAAADLNLASVAAAIAARSELTNTYALKTELATAGGSLTSKYPMRRLGYQAAAQVNGDVKHIRWLTFGSSVGDIKIREVGPLVAAAFGGRQAGAILGSWSTSSGPAVGGVTVSTVTQNSTTGTVTGLTNEYDVWVTGNATGLNSAGSITWGIGGGAFTCDTIEIYYTTGPATAKDGGTFSYQVDAGGTTNVVTLAGSQGVGRTVINPTLGSHTLTTAWVSGNVRIIGVGFVNSTVTGFLPINASRGGLVMDSITDLAWSNWQTFLGWAAPDVITHECKDSQIDATAQVGVLSGYPFVSMRKWLNAIAAVATDYAGPDVLIIGSTPAANLGPQLEVNTALVALAATYQASPYLLNVLVWDGYSPLGSWSYVNAMGWGGDGTHLPWQAQRFLASLLLRDTGILNIIEGTSYLPRNLLGSVLGPSVALRRTQDTAAAATLVAETASGLDAQVRAGRHVDFTSSDGTTTWGRFSNQAVGASYLPDRARLGSTTGAAFWGNTASKVYLMDGTSMTSKLCGLRIGGLIVSTQAASVSGSVTVDLSPSGTGGCTVLTLTGNVTSFAFSNPYEAGHEVEVHFVQDATGSRTLAGANANIKWAGGAPTLTTTASKRDIFKFRYDGTSYWETFRSMNVG